MSETVYEAAKEDFVFRYLDTIQVKGKDTPVKIYELIGKKDVVDSGHTHTYIRFIKATEYYKSQNFEKALEIFQTLADAGDKPSLTYIERCQQYIKTPPSKDWNGVWRMMEK